MIEGELMIYGKERRKKQEKINEARKQQGSQRVNIKKEIEKKDTKNRKQVRKRSKKIKMRT